MRSEEVRLYSRFLAAPPLSHRRLAPRTLTKDFERTTLKPHHRPVIRALAEAMFSPDGEVEPERLDAFVDELDAFISPASKTLRFGLVLMTFAVRWSPLLSLRLSPFEALPVDDRVRHLERLERSKVAQLPLLVVAFKTILTLLFYEDEGEQRAIGYPGPERRRWRRALPTAPAALREEAST